MKKQRLDAVRGYRIDFTTNTVYLDKRFTAAATRDFLSPEAKRLRDIQEAFPQITIITKAGREITTARPTKRLTYKNMEKYISAFENAAELLEVFETVKKKSAPLKSPYKYVRDWFEKTFPDYKIAKPFTEDEDKPKEKREPAPLPDVSKYPVKPPKSEEAEDEKDNEFVEEEDDDDDELPAAS